MRQAERDTRSLFVILTLGFGLLPISTDLYLASLPGLAAYFGVSAAKSQLTLSVFVAGFAVSQLFYGPIADRWGRRPTLLGGVAVYLLATLVCVAAPSIEILIAGRLLQGVGACSGTVVARATVRDVYGAEGAGRMLAFLATGVSLFPLAGPVIGGFVETALGWRWNLAILGVVAAGLLALTVGRFPETSPYRNPAATRLAPMLANYRTLVRDRRYVGYVVCLACTYGGLFAYISGSSFVLIEVLGVPPQRFGFWFSATVAGYLVGSYFTGRVAPRMGAAPMMKVATIFIAAAGTLLAALALAGVRAPLAVAAPMMLYLLAAGVTMPLSMAGALSAYPRMAGAASALMGLSQMLLAATVGFVVGRLFDGTPVPMAAAVCAMSWAILLAYRGLVGPAERAT